MSDLPDLSRRDLLAGVGVSGMGLISGCQGQESTPTETTTVVFTDSTTRTQEPDSAEETTETTTVKTDTVVSSSIATTQSAGREESGPIVFDGGNMEAFVQAVKTANEAAEGTVIIEEGQYHFDPLEQANAGSLPAHAKFQGLKDVTLEGNGSTFLFTEPLIYTLAFRGGKNITIRDLSFDYDPVPFTQGTITERSKDPLSVKISLDDGYPELDHPMFDRTDEFYGLLHESNGQFVRGIAKRGSWDPKISGVSKLDRGEYELEINDAFQSGGLEPDRKLTVLARNNKGGLSVQYVDNPTLENVSVHATNGGAIGVTVCKDPVIRDCTIAPPSDSDRHIGANADGIRIINCRSSVTIEGCRHEYLGDDSLVIQNTLSPVTSIIDERTVAVENVHPFVVATGDVLDILSPTGKRKGSLAPVKEFESRFPLPGEHEKPKTITFEEPVEDRVTEGDFLRNRATGSQNFEVRNNEFRHHRANLIRIAASHGVIEDNTLAGCPINPIELETDTFGYFAPKGWTSDVTVRNNSISLAGLNYFAGGNPVGIHIHHRPAPEYATEGYPNRNISISGNEITESATGAIHVEAARDIALKGNTMSDLNRMEFPGFADIAVSLDRASDVTLRDNSAKGASGSLDYFGIQRDSQNLKASGNSVVIGGESQSADLVSLAPLKVVFNRTVRPSEVNPDSSDDRQLAFRCKEIVLVDRSGDELRRIDVGNDEGGISYGTGVWDPSSDGEWRWFGGPSKTAMLYFADVELREANRVRFRGYPMEAGISAATYIDEQQVGEVTFDSETTQWYTVDIASED